MWITARQVQSLYGEIQVNKFEHVGAGTKGASLYGEGRRAEQCFGGGGFPCDTHAHVRTCSLTGTSLRQTQLKTSPPHLRWRAVKME